MQNVSFGSKIPLSTAQVYDKKAQEFKKTVLYELDGHDASDVDELAMRTGAWEYKYCMTADLASKNQKLDSNRGGGKFISTSTTFAGAEQILYS